MEGIEAKNHLTLLSLKILYRAREKNIRKWNSIFDIIKTYCTVKQNLSKEVIMDINGLKF